MTIALDVHQLTVEEAAAEALKDEMAGVTTALNTATSNDPALGTLPDALIEVMPSSRDASHPPSGPLAVRLWVTASNSTNASFCVGVDRVRHDLEVRCFAQATERRAGVDESRLQTSVARLARLLARAVQVVLERHLQAYPGSEIDLVTTGDGSGAALDLPGRPNMLGTVLKFVVYQKIYSGYGGS